MGTFKRVLTLSMLKRALFLTDVLNCHQPDAPASNRIRATAPPSAACCSDLACVDWGFKFSRLSGLGEWSDVNIVALRPGKKNNLV